MGSRRYSQEDSGNVLGRATKNEKTEGDLSQQMRDISILAGGIRLTITCLESGRSDFLSISSRNLPTNILVEKYCEALREHWHVSEIWFEYTDIELSFNGVTLDKNKRFSLTHYGIRPGSIIFATYFPKVKIKIKNQTGTRKAYSFWGTWDMTIQAVKEKYQELRFDIGRHDWTAEDIVLLDNEGLLVDDDKKLEGYIKYFSTANMKKRGRAHFGSNYRRNGNSYLFTTRAYHDNVPSEIDSTTFNSNWSDSEFNG